MKRKLPNCRIMKPMPLLAAILFCLFSGSLLAQKSSVDRDLKNIERNMPALASNHVLEKEQLNKPFDVTVSGTVTDQNGQPIAGATVSVPGTSIGTATDLDGKYSISVPENATLVYSFIGFESQTVGVNNQSTIDISLLESTQALEEVVVVGYGTQKKKDLTGAIVNVQAEEVMKYNPTSVSEILRTTVPGLSVGYAYPSEEPVRFR